MESVAPSPPQFPSVNPDAGVRRVHTLKDVSKMSTNSSYASCVPSNGINGIVSFSRRSWLLSGATYVMRTRSSVRRTAARKPSRCAAAGSASGTSTTPAPTRSRSVCSAERTPTSLRSSCSSLKVDLNVTFITSLQSPEDRSTTFDFKHGSTPVETNLWLLKSYYGISILQPFFWSFKRKFAQKLAMFKMTSAAL